MNEEQKSCDIFEFPFERNNYYYGKLMTQREYFAEQSYFNKKRWLINRLVNGWGVVCGLEVKPILIDSNNPSKGYDTNRVKVTPGMAIDCCGREIIVYEEQVKKLNPEINPNVICLEHFKCKTERVHIPFIECEQKDKFEFNRIRDSFQIVIKDQGKVDMEWPLDENCPLSEDKLKPLDDYVCEKLMAGCPECPEQPCLVLAEITINSTEENALQENSPEQIFIDQCSKRRLVYNNPLLYDLFHCFHGDFPHVVSTNWTQGREHEYIELEKKKSLVSIEPIELIIKFDKQMDEQTINKKTYLFFVKMTDWETGNYRYEQVPGEISYKYDENENESNATFTVKTKWLIDVYLGYSKFQEEEGGDFMVVLKGDFIMSKEENQKALDGNFIGGSLPSGNGTQGGDFISWFSLKPPEQPRRYRKSEEE